MSGAQLAKSTLASRITVQGLTLLFNVLTARLLGPSGKGILALGMLWALVLSSVATAGMEVGLTYFVSKTPASASQYFRIALKHAAWAGSAAGLTFLVAVKLWPALFRASDTARFLTAGMVPIQAATLLTIAICVGAGVLPVANRLLIITWTLNALAVGSLLVFRMAEPELVLAVVVATALLQILLTGSVALRETNPVSIVSLRPLLDYSRRAYLGTIAGLLHLSASGIILGMVAGAAAVGVFSVAYAVAAALFLVPVVIGTVLLPKVAGAGIADAQQATLASMRASLLITFVLGVGAAVSSLAAIPLVFGEQFRGAVPVIVLLMPAALGFAASKPLTAYFQGQGLPAVGSSAAVFGLAVVLITGWPLSRTFGAMGAAIAMSLSTLAMAALQLLLFRKYMPSMIARDIFPGARDAHLLRRLAASRRPSRSAGDA